MNYEKNPAPTLQRGPGPEMIVTKTTIDNRPGDQAQALSEARDSAYEELTLVRGYIDAAHTYLRIDDDAGAVCSLASARVHFVSALRAFMLVREAMKSREGSR